MLIIFGRSPFINEIRDYIPELIKKHTTIGINYFCNTYPDVDYVCFYDDIVPEVKNSTIITAVKNIHNPLIDTHEHELWNVKKVYETFSDERGLLHLWIHTPSMALNWAYRKGYRNVVLAGIDLSHGRFDNFPCEEFSDLAIKQARDHLENVATKYLNIYQLNPNSDLNLPKIKMENLL